MINEIKYPHSLGLLYSAMTAHCGFKVNSGEYKLMGLAPWQTKVCFGDRGKSIDIAEDGSFFLNMDYFDFPAGQKMYSDKFLDLFGVPERSAESNIETFQMDVASSIQAVTEKLCFAWRKRPKNYGCTKSYPSGRCRTKLCG